MVNEKINKRKSGPRSIWDNVKNIEIMKNEYPTLGAKGVIQKYKWDIKETNVRNKAFNLGIKMDKLSFNKLLSKRVITKEWKEKISKSNTKYNVDYVTEERIINMYKAGYYMNFISKEMFLYPKIIKDILIKNNIKIENYTRYSIEELEYLKNNYYEEDKEIIIKNLKNRKWKSIISKAKYLGLKRSKKFVSEKVIKRNKKNNSMKNTIHKKTAKKNTVKLIKKNPFFHRDYLLKNNKETEIEKKLMKLLDKNNIKYEFNKAIVTKIFYKIPDFLIKNKLIIEADGIFWHKDKNKILKRDKELEEMGYEILHFTNTEINNNLNEVEECILKKLKQLNL